MPFPFATLGVSAGLGLLNSLFGKRKDPNYTMADLEKFGYKKTNTAQEIADLIRNAEAMKKRYRTNAEQQARETGIDQAASSYAGIEPIDTQTLTGIGAIKEAGRQEDNDIALKLFGLNEADKDRSTGFERALEGGIVGAGIGSQIDNFLTPRDPGKEDIDITEEDKQVGVSVGQDGKSLMPPQKTVPGVFKMPPMEVGEDIRPDWFKGKESFTWKDEEGMGSPFKDKTSLSKLTGMPNTSNELSYLQSPNFFSLRDLFNIKNKK